MNSKKLKKHIPPLLYLLTCINRHIKASSSLWTRKPDCLRDLWFRCLLSMGEEVEIAYPAEYCTSKTRLLKSHLCRDPCTGAQIRVGHANVDRQHWLIWLTISYFIFHFFIVVEAAGLNSLEMLIHMFFVECLKWVVTQDWPFGNMAPSGLALVSSFPLYCLSSLLTSCLLWWTTLCWKFWFVFPHPSLTCNTLSSTWTHDSS